MVVVTCVAGSSEYTKLENDGYASSPRVMCIDATSTGLSTSNAASMLRANNSNAKLMFDAESSVQKNAICLNFQSSINKLPSINSIFIYG